MTRSRSASPHRDSAASRSWCSRWHRLARRHPCLVIVTHGEPSERPTRTSTPALNIAFGTATRSRSASPHPLPAASRSWRFRRHDLAHQPLDRILLAPDAHSVAPSPSALASPPTFFGISITTLFLGISITTLFLWHQHCHPSLPLLVYVPRAGHGFSSLFVHVPRNGHSFSLLFVSCAMGMASLFAHVPRDGHDLPSS